MRLLPWTASAGQGSAPRSIMQPGPLELTTAGRIPPPLGRASGPPGPCPPSLGLLCPPWACARSSRPRWSWSASAGSPPGSPGAPRRRYGQRPAPRIRPCLAPRRGEVPRRGGEGPLPRPAPAIFPQVSGRDFPRNTRPRIFPRITRGPGVSPRNASANNHRITKINDGSTKISLNSFAENRR